MARQALIKLRRGTGAPGANVLAEGELAIDIAAKKLYSANSSGSAFTLSGDQYNFVPSGNSSQASLTLTVDNDALSNDSDIIEQAIHESPSYDAITKAFDDSRVECRKLWLKKMDKNDIK